MTTYKDVDTNTLSLSYYPYFFFNRIYSNIRPLVLEDKFEANEVVSGIYIGGIESSYDKSELKRLNITHIISAIPGYEPQYPNEFKYLVINSLDDENTKIKEIFEDTNSFIDEAFCERGNILVHCLRGVSRSSTIVCAYLISTFALNYDDVLTIIQNKRNIVQPNPYFQKQLRDYYNYKYLNLV